MPCNTVLPRECLETDAQVIASHGIDLICLLPEHGGARLITQEVSELC